MIKIMIVDDDYIVRKGLAKTIDFKKLGMELVATSENGRDALDKFRQIMPDIVITDVCMPYMNGIEFIEYACKINPGCKFIILSGYNNFEYVRSALALDACDYLLKPLENGAIERALLNAKAKHDKDSVLASMGSNLLYLKNDFWKKALQGTIDKAEIKEKSSIYDIDIPKSSDFFVIYAEKPRFTEVPLITDSSVKIITVNINAQTYAIIVFTTEGNKHEIINSFMEQNKDVVIGVSALGQDICDIHNLYQQAELAHKNSKASDSLVSFYVATHHSGYHVVLDAINIVKSHYSTQLHLQDIADELQISKSYLITVFKKHMGISLTDYITEYRMKVAKDLLALKRFKIYEICYKVGYNDIKSFRNAFKKAHGFLPTEADKIK